MNEFIEKKGLLSNERLFFSDFKNEEVIYRHIRRYLYIIEKRKPELKPIITVLKQTHNIRRCVLNEIYMKTKSIISAKEFIGHSDIKTTLRYISETTKEIEVKKALNVIKEKEERI